MLIAVLLAATSSGFAATTAAEDEFVAVFGAARPQLDPQRSIYSSEAQLFTAVYEGLFSYEPSSLEPRNAAVATWSLSKDRLTYLFEIRADALWSDGSPLRAADFRNAWLRMLELNADYAAFFDVIEGAREYRMNDLADPAHVGIRALDDRRLEVTLSSPVAYFTRLLCHHSFAPIHPSMLSRSDWDAAFPYPVNGPYRFAGRTADEMTLTRNERYWDAANVKIPHLRLVFTDDDALATAMFDGGQAHWLIGPGDLDALLSQDAIQANPMFSTHYWFFDSGTGPWKDARVRRALALMLPWQSMRSTDFYRLPAQTLVLPMPGYSKVKGIEAQDLREAARLLEETGHVGGRDLPPVRIVFVEGKDTRRIVTAMRDAWKPLSDLKVELVALPYATYYDTIGKGSAEGAFTLAHTTWIGDFADPMAFLQMWTSGSSLNDAGYADPSYDKAIADSQTREGMERLNLLAEAETMLLRDAVVMPMYHSFAVSVIDTDYIGGWFQNPLDIHPFKSLEFGERSIRPNVARNAMRDQVVSASFPR